MRIGGPRQRNRVPTARAHPVRRGSARQVSVRARHAGRQQKGSPLLCRSVRGSRLLSVNAKIIARDAVSQNLVGLVFKRRTEKDRWRNGTEDKDTQGKGKSCPLTPPPSSSFSISNCVNTSFCSLSSYITQASFNYVTLSPWLIPHCPSPDSHIYHLLVSFISLRSCRINVFPFDDLSWP